MKNSFVIPRTSPYNSHMFKWALAFLTLFLLIFGQATAQDQLSSHYKFPQGKVSLVPINNGVGLKFDIIKDWHIYWENPGDSGSAPKWKWQTKGSVIKSVQWPVPERIPVKNLVNFGYSNSVVFKALFEEPLVTHVAVDLEFLICKVECIPYFTNLSLDLATNTLLKLDISKENIYPKAESKDITLSRGEFKSDIVSGLVKAPDQNNISEIHIFPYDGLLFEAKSPTISNNGTDFNFAIKTTPDATKENTKDSKFLVAVHYKDGSVIAETVRLKQSEPNLALILFWAFLGGLILNIMPCVLPVLSIKILSFLGPNQNKKQLKISGLLYSLGVTLSFLGLGALLLILRAGGEKIGWGFQLQNPYVTAGIAVLFFWLALNFLGTFEIGYSLTRADTNLNSKSYWGSFLTGILATIIATPCTAPFMGVALGAALLLPPYQTLFVFASLGIGMAFPFLVLAYFPALLRFIPKPGIWMIRFKQFLAFPLLATVIWLLWVLGLQTSFTSLIGLISLFIGIGFIIWISDFIKSLQYKQALLFIGFLISFLALYSLPVQKISNATASKITSNWNTFSESEIKQLRDAQIPVFIDFTAAWCITCQVNKQLVLNTDDIQEEFKRRNIKLFKADWTDRDPIITKALAKFGRNSLPLYVYYPAGSHEPIILPEILTKSIVLDALNKTATIQKNKKEQL